jgi:hypothetical protein
MSDELISRPFRLCFCKVQGPLVLPNNSSVLSSSRTLQKSRKQCNVRLGTSPVNRHARPLSVGSGIRETIGRKKCSKIRCLKHTIDKVEVKCCCYSRIKCVAKRNHLFSNRNQSPTLGNGNHTNSLVVLFGTNFVYNLPKFDLSMYYSLCFAKHMLVKYGDQGVRLTREIKEEWYPLFFFLEITEIRSVLVILRVKERGDVK